VTRALKSIVVSFSLAAAELQGRLSFFKTLDICGQQFATQKLKP